ncbi:putative Xaa-Pro aminopeptidase P [Tetrabaena socialis]|uniref:Putative Xaa-Pro aminopeptidase P n=1 Tax=Tetrabaena socialis TaxID=47790 RepID=A0A2J8AEB3_9CHLO|nr:putative Xaa-Pro aminopeptidase P [Tetrabaena socialis]|eukprot:PNH10857.1 putative Xaa-Pro aminopeptidase P [Tetrabaena socialis]
MATSSRPSSLPVLIGKVTAFATRRTLPRLTVAYAKLGTRGFGSLTSTSPGGNGSTVAQPSAAPGATYNGVNPAAAPTMAAAPAATADPKLSALRAAMAAADGGRGVAAYLAPTEDPHMSEYPPACLKYREFITNFTGTAGTAVVTTDAALLWTDGRYFLQANTELGPEWTLMKAGTPGCPDLEDWLALNLPDGARVGIDPWVHTVNSVRTLQRKLDDAGKVLVPLLEDGNLISKVWADQRPPAPDAPLRVHPLRWAGEDLAAKLVRMREQMRQAGAAALLVSSLDEVAWLTNTRGGDVDHNPVALSYALLTPGAATLYVDAAKVVPPVAEQLQAAGVQVKPYDGLLADVSAVAASGERLWLDPARVSYAVYQAAAKAASEAASKKRPREEEGGAAANGHKAAAAPRGFRPVELASPVVGAKAIKNAAELEGMREAHLRDAVAVSQFMVWLQAKVAEGVTVTEVEVDEALTGFRAAQPGFVETSFSTIAGAGPNGAIIHYRAQPGTCRSVDASTLLLLDSGGQYDCGTTDITRTVHTGTPTDHQRRCFTRVLQGHIALDSAVWPEGTPGAALDTLARTALWREGLNYRHGTGHGVGAALNVHEGPQSISSRAHITTPLQAHMVCSNEPGYYEDGSFGVRIENLVVVVEKETPFRYGGQQYLGFARLTLVPLQAKMIDTGLLSPEEVAWVDAYHHEVWQQVSPRMQDQPALLKWLQANTRPLAEQK